MRFQVVHAWPVASYVVPAGQIIDRASGDGWSQFAQHIPPPDAIALDSGAAALLATTYTPWGTTREQYPPPNINNF
jgi:hypothetical protein